MEIKIQNGLTRLAAPYLRDPAGVVCPAVNGVEVLETRETLTVTIHVSFLDETDLAIATEIIELGIVEFSNGICASSMQVGERLEIKYVFSREKVLGLSPSLIAMISESLSSFKERLKAEVLSSKIRLSADIRTAISHTSRVYASHSSSVIRGA